MISLMEIYYPSNFGLDISSDDVASAKKSNSTSHQIDEKKWEIH